MKLFQPAFFAFNFLPGGSLFLSGPETYEWLKSRLDGDDPGLDSYDPLAESDFRQDMQMLYEIVGPVAFRQATAYFMGPLTLLDGRALVQGETESFEQTASLDVPSSVLQLASQSTLPPAAPNEAPVSEPEVRGEDRRKPTGWKGLPTQRLGSILRNDRRQEFRKAALALLFERYHEGSLDALVELAASAKRSEGARIKFHDLIAENDIALAHLIKVIRKEPKKRRPLFFALRSLVGRVHDFVQDEFERLVQVGKMKPLSPHKMSLVEEAINGIDDDALGSWAAKGSRDAIEELMTRYTVRRDRKDPAADSALVEIADAAEKKAYALECLILEGRRSGLDQKLWGEIDDLAIRVPRVAEMLSDYLKAGYRSNFLISLCGAAEQSPYAAHVLCDLAKHFHQKNDFHMRDHVLIHVKDLNLSRYGELTKTDRAAIDALYELDYWGADQARRQLEIAAETNLYARKVLAGLKGDKQT